MTIKNVPVSGRVIWHELLCPDLEAAKGFYGELFGWKTRGMDMGPMGTYTLISAGDRDIGGIVEQKGASLWLPYLSHGDVDAAVRTAAALGANVISPASTIPTVGRMATLQHAVGGTFAAFCPEKPAAESEAPPALGSFCWNELLTQELAAAVALVRGVFGVESSTRSMGPLGDYTLFQAGERELGGCMKAMDPRAPSAWLGYVLVADLEVSHKKAQKLGAKELVGVTSIPDMGRFTVVSDRQGAMMGLFQGGG